MKWDKHGRKWTEGIFFLEISKEKQMNVQHDLPIDPKSFSFLIY